MRRVEIMDGAGQERVALAEKSFLFKLFVTEPNFLRVELRATKERCRQPPPILPIDNFLPPIHALGE